MSRCFIEGMGGGIGKLFAAIGVKYPAGSTLTCTNGTKTLKAKTTTGQWMFAVPEPGTWIVTATDGKATASKTVEITAEGQSVSVVLEYRIYLYRAGDQCIDITGGWKAFTPEGHADWVRSLLTLNTNSMDGVAPSTSTTAGECYRCTGKAIDVSKKTLKVQYDAEITGSQARMIIRVLNGTASIADVERYEKGTDLIAEIDTSAITTAVKIYVSALQLRNAGSCSISVKNIWLE